MILKHQKLQAVHENTIFLILYQKFKKIYIYLFCGTDISTKIFLYTFR